MSTGTTIEISAPDGPFPAYEAIGSGAAKGAIIVIQEAFGVNEHIEDVTRRFADQGYRAVAPHIYHRTGSPTLGYDDFSKVAPHMQALDDSMILADVDATLAHLATAGFSADRTGIVGFCMGGRISFLVATQRKLGAAVGFYGGGIVTTRFAAMPALLDGIDGMRTPWLAFFGDTDASIPVSDVEKLRDELSQRAIPDTEIVRYAQAGHGFFCDLRPSYDAQASADAWPKTLDWFAHHLP
ncbi:MAG: dienelactone hydrolase family protein [Acidimicrobiales bacterium]